MFDIPTARSPLRQTHPRRHANGYPEAVPAHLLEFARDRIAESHTLSTIARDLAVNLNTIKSWLTRTPVETTSRFLAMGLASVPPPDSRFQSRAPSQPPQPLRHSRPRHPLPPRQLRPAPVNSRVQQPLPLPCPPPHRLPRRPLLAHAKLATQSKLDPKGSSYVSPRAPLSKPIFER